MGSGGVVTGALGIGASLLGGGKKAPGAPGVVPPQDYIDNIFGTSVKQVKNADGEYQMVVDRTISAEDQARLDTLNEMYNSYMGDLESLTSIQSALDIPAFDPVISATRENQRLSREEAYKTRSNLEENTLARRGVGDSTTASEVRQMRGNDMTKQASADERDLILLAEQLRSNAINNTATGLNFAGTAIQQDKENAFNSSQRLLQAQQSMYSASNQATQQNYQSQLQSIAYNNQQKRQQTQDIMQAVGFAAGGMGGGFGGSAGGGFLSGGNTGISTAMQSSPLYSGASYDAGTGITWNPYQSSQIQWNRYGS